MTRPHATSDGPLDVGVVGVGTMGRHHARVYAELRDANLVGVADADAERAGDVAREHDVDVFDTADLLEAVDAVSVAVPTEYHAEVVRSAIDVGAHVLVEKPFVADREAGRELISRAEDRGVVLQVGHVERFNPAVRALADLVDPRDVVAVTADRLGPPIAREIGDGAVMDLMIHDIDVVLWLLGTDVASVDAVGAHGHPYVTSTLSFANGTVGRLTASRCTQQKVRELTVTTPERRVVVDYLDQSVRIYRAAVPEYVETEGDVRHRQSTVVERPSIEGEEPLAAELTAFLDACRTGRDPDVTGADGLRALKLAEKITAIAGHGADAPEVRGR